MSVTDKLHSEIDPYEPNEMQASMTAEDADRHAGMARRVMAVGAAWVAVGGILVAVVLLAASLMRGV